MVPVAVQLRLGSVVPADQLGILQLSLVSGTLAVPWTPVSDVLVVQWTQVSEVLEWTTLGSVVSVVAEGQPQVLL